MATHASHFVRRRSTQLALVFGLAIALVGSALAFTNSSTVNAAAMSTAAMGSGGASYCYGELLVPQRNADSATVINQATGLITHTVGVGALPSSVTYSGDGRLAFVANDGAQSITVIDTSNNAVLRTLQMNQRIFSVVSNYDGSGVWAVAYLNPNFSLLRIDSTTGSVLATYVLQNSPLDLVMSPDQATLWVFENSYPDTLVRELDPATLTVTSTTQVQAFAYQVAINPSGTTIYMPNMSGGGITAFDTQTLTTTTFGPTISYYFGAAISPDGTTLYTVGFDSAYEVYAFDLSNNSWTVGVDLTPITQIGNLLYGMAITADGSKIYISNMNYASGGLFVIETSDISAASFIPTEIYARAATCPLSSDPDAPATTTTTSASVDPLAPAFTG